MILTVTSCTDMLAVAHGVPAAGAFAPDVGLLGQRTICV